MKAIILFKQKSSILPDLKFQKTTQFDESPKTTRFHYKPKLLVIKDKENCKNKNNDIINKEKKEIIHLRNEPDAKKRSLSNKIIINSDKAQKNMNELKEEIESLKNQLNDEKLKSEVLKEIAEDEQKKHLLYKKKFKTIAFSKRELLIDEINSTKNILTPNNKNNLYMDINNCNQVKNAINNNNSVTSRINACLSSPRHSPGKIIYINKIKKSFSNRKYKYLNFKKIKEELIELKQKNSEKDKKILDLENQITQLKKNNIELLRSKNAVENEIIKLKEEVNIKNNENEKLNLKLNEEKKANKLYIEKLNEIKKIKEKYAIKLQYEKEQIVVLKKLLNKNENLVCNKYHKNNIEISFDKNTKRSLEISGLKDISNISCINNKLHMEQYEQDDMTLKEIIQDKLFDIIDKK